MAIIMKFEDLDAWRAARVFAGAVYAASSIGKFSKDFSLKDQIRRSAISAMSNIAEGFERDGNREFLQFLAIAKGSCGEVRAQLFIALDQAYIRKDEFQSLCQKAVRLSCLLLGLMKALT
jgi:four helix bundle protein